MILFNLRNQVKALAPFAVGLLFFLAPNPTAGIPAAMAQTKVLASFEDGVPVFRTVRTPRAGRTPDKRRARDRRRTSRRDRTQRKHNRHREQSRGPRIGQALPKKAPAGTTQLVVVSLTNQHITVYQDGQPISRSRVSTGKDGHRTPTGIFSIIQKRRFHRSNIYSGAPMPFMQRITWSGIALHQGVVPGYRASHGCIRLPASYARALFAYTHHRAHVIVAHDDPAPVAIKHTALLTPSDPGHIQPVRTAGVVTSDGPRPIEIALGKPQFNPAMPGQVMTDARQRILPQTVPADVAAIYDMDNARAVAHRRMMHATRDAAPLRILVTRRTLTVNTSEAQTLLTALGHDAGEADGIAGTQTVAALKAYQTSRGLPATGTLDTALLARLRADAGRPAVPEFMLLIRQGGRLIFEAPVTMQAPSRPLGTHLFLMQGSAQTPINSTQPFNWSAMTLKAPSSVDGQPVTAANVLDRLEIPSHVRAAITDRLTPGSSMIVTDSGSERETGQMTDFIVLTRKDRVAGR